MDGRIFDGLISFVLFLGALIGLVVAALGYGAWWLFCHISVRWV
jgi:hypothetical protein